MYAYIEMMYAKRYTFFKQHFGRTSQNWDTHIYTTHGLAFW